MTFANTDLRGRIDMRTRDIIGDIGPNVHARAFAVGQGTLRLNPLSSTSSDPFENQGTLDLDVSDVGLHLQHSGPLINEGTIEMIGGNEVSLWAESLVNRGSLIVEGTLDVDGAPGSNAGQVRNEGDIDVAPGGLIRVSEADFVSTLGAQMSGSLELHDGARLVGAGAMGSVRSFGGVIGGPGVDGRLSFGSLVLDPASRVILSVDGTEPGSYDELALLGLASLGGVLEIQTAPGFEGGICGQVIPIITRTLRLKSSSFGATIGLNQGPTAAWRLHEFADGISLTGYRPGKGQLSVTPSGLALSEGGVGSEYHLCLGATTPNADVIVTPVDATGQVTLSGARTFRTSDWMLPRTLRATAVDDALVEGPHTVSVTHTTTSADPVYSGSRAFGRLTVDITDNDGESDLGITLVSQEDGRSVGDLLSTVFRVENLGPTESSGSTVTTTALVGLDYDSASGADCSVDGARVVTCLIDPIAAGGQAEFTLTFVGAVVGVHAQTLTVVGQQPDPDNANDTVLYTQRIN